MRERILKWLFGTHNIDDYFDLLVKNRDNFAKQMKLIDDHLKTLERSKENVETVLKLIKICENHGIDVDEEIKHIQLNEVKANETVD